MSADVVAVTDTREWVEALADEWERNSYLPWARELRAALAASEPS